MAATLAFCNDIDFSDWATYRDVHRELGALGLAAEDSFVADGVDVLGIGAPDVAEPPYRAGSQLQADGRAGCAAHKEAIAAGDVDVIDVAAPD